LYKARIYYINIFTRYKSSEYVFCESRVPPSTSRAVGYSPTLKKLLDRPVDQQLPVELAHTVRNYTQGVLSPLRLRGCAGHRQAALILNYSKWDLNNEQAKPLSVAALSRQQPYVLSEAQPLHTRETSVGTPGKCSFGSDEAKPRSTILMSSEPRQSIVPSTFGSR
jgi:hypothetical protein